VLNWNPNLAFDSISPIVEFQSSRLSIVLPYTTMTTASKTSHADTPPQSPEVKAKDLTKLEMALKFIVDYLAPNSAPLNKFSLPPPPLTPPNTPKEPLTERVRASKLRYKSITET